MPTVGERIKLHLNVLTRAERQIADAINQNYPISGLASITVLAEAAEVSTPSVARMAQKLGFSGYPELQAALKEELSAMISSPAERRAALSDAAERHPLNNFAEAAATNMGETLELLDPAEFDHVVALLADPDRRLTFVGGRIMGVLARYTYLHLQMIRPDVAFIPPEPSWPQHLQDVREGDVVVIFDVRRYESAMLTLAELSHERGAEIVLFTDQWRSPIHRKATVTLAARGGAPSPWDSSLAMMMLVEALIAAVYEATPETAQDRIDALEAAFNRTGQFRKFT